jgi:hypothetical protein
VRHAPPLESSFANLLLNIQGENETVVFTIVHEKAGTTQLRVLPDADASFETGTRWVGCAGGAARLRRISKGRSVRRPAMPGGGMCSNRGVRIDMFQVVFQAKITS